MTSWERGVEGVGVGARVSMSCEGRQQQSSQQQQSNTQTAAAHQLTHHLLSCDAVKGGRQFDVCVWGGGEGEGAAVWLAAGQELSPRTRAH
jgi:hypothetical protein